MPIQMHNSQGPPIFVMNKLKGFKSNTINSDKTESQNRRQNLMQQASNSDRKENQRTRQNIIKQTSNSDILEIQRKRQDPIQQKSKSDHKNKQGKHQDFIQQKSISDMVTIQRRRLSAKYSQLFRLVPPVLLDISVQPLFENIIETYAGDLPSAELSNNLT
ncbi:uncharacterized protein LOC144358424 [Saccoglossus kowalevskii]